MTEITGGELLVRCLNAERVRHIIAIPDGTYMIVMEALERLGDELDMRLIVPRHEAAGGHMADAMTRVTGAPAVVMACAGPGAANLLSAVICAESEGSPVVAITTIRRSDVSDDYRQQGGTQSPHHMALFAPTVKWGGRVNHWSRIPDMVRHAFRVATSGRPGPVHLAIPEDVLNSRGEFASVRLWEPERYRLTAPQTAPAEAVRQAARLLVEARLPNIHAGGGASRSGAGEVVQALAEHLGCPVTCTVGARGIIPEDHPLFLSPLCLASFAAHNQADVVLGVGTRFGELAMFGKEPAWADPAQQKLVQIDADPASIGLNKPVDLGLVGDARTIVQQILDEVKTLTPPRPPHMALGMLRPMQDDWQRDLDQPVADMDRAPMLTGAIFKVCNEFFPPAAVCVLDGGNTVMWGQHYHQPRRQRATLYTANMGYLGTGLPYALGAQLAEPDRPVYCVTGDSAFGFNIQELETAARHRLPVIIIVAVDGAYGMEKSAQQRVFGRPAPWFGSDHAPVRYDLVAQAMGCHGELVETAADLRPALERAAASGKPAVIHAVVDAEANVDPPGMWLWVAARSGKMNM